MRTNDITPYAKRFIQELVVWEVERARAGIAEDAREGCWYNAETVQARNLCAQQELFRAGKGRNDFWNPSEEYSWMKTHMERMRMHLIPVIVAGSQVMQLPSVFLADEKEYHSARQSGAVDLERLGRALASDVTVQRYFFDLLRFVIEQEQHLYRRDGIVKETNPLREGMVLQLSAAADSMRRTLYQLLDPWYRSLVPHQAISSIEKELAHYGYVNLES